MAHAPPDSTTHLLKHGHKLTSMPLPPILHISTPPPINMEHGHTLPPRPAHWHMLQPTLSLTPPSKRAHAHSHPTLRLAMGSLIQYSCSKNMPHSAVRTAPSPSPPLTGGTCDTCSTRHNQLTPAANFSHGTHLQLTTTDKTTTHQMLLTTTLTTPLTITQLDAICSASPC